MMGILSCAYIPTAMFWVVWDFVSVVLFFPRVSSQHVPLKRKPLLMLMCNHNEMY